MRSPVARVRVRSDPPLVASDPAASCSSATGRSRCAGWASATCRTPPAAPAETATCPPKSTSQAPGWPRSAARTRSSASPLPNAPASIATVRAPGDRATVAVEPQPRPARARPRGAQRGSVRPAPGGAQVPGVDQAADSRVEGAVRRPPPAFQPAQQLADRRRHGQRGAHRLAVQRAQRAVRAPGAQLGLGGLDDAPPSAPAVRARPRGPPLRRRIPPRRPSGRRCAPGGPAAEAGRPPRRDTAARRRRPASWCEFGRFRGRGGPRGGQPPHDPPADDQMRAVAQHEQRAGGDVQPDAERYQRRVRRHLNAVADNAMTEKPTREVHRCAGSRGCSSAASAACGSGTTCRRRR